MGGFERAGGLFHVRYVTPADVLPAAQADLLRAVRMAADAFNIANILRRKPVAVKSFLSSEVVQAQTWLVEQIHGAADAP